MVGSLRTIGFKTLIKSQNYKMKPLLLLAQQICNRSLPLAVTPIRTLFMSRTLSLRLLSMEANLPVTTADPPSAVTDLMDDVDTEDSATEASLPVAIAAPPSSAVQPTNVVTIMDDTDHYADHVDAAIARGSVLNTHMSTYFNVPLNPNPNVKLYYITRGHKIGVFSGWNNVSPWVLGVSRAVYERVDTVEEGIEIVKFAIEDGIAARV
ncbi:hypothetical protein M405DRAFT_846382 [Rhizopogon salebrosus TDB-379]|nr:hypothetical protein M405DRAFT_846382 [Rhizopogon salebrosus TDB-379]